VGHSMGGQVVMTLALDHPDRVEALVLSAPAGFERFQPGHAAWMKDFWTEGRAMQSREEDIRLTFENHVFNHKDEGVERLIEERVRLGRHPDFAGTSVAVSRSIAGMLDHPVLERLDQLRVPTLIVYGTDDRMIPNPVFNGGRTRTVAEAGHAAIVDSQLVMIDKAGHTVHHDAPARWNEAVSAFLEKP
jgi:pimeloyl-ACP methyl ester carboxylesterase